MLLGVRRADYYRWKYRDTVSKRWCKTVPIEGTPDPAQYPQATRLDYTHEVRLIPETPGDYAQRSREMSMRKPYTGGPPDWMEARSNEPPFTSDDDGTSSS